MTENTIFLKRLEELINLSGKSFNQIEKELGYPRNALHNYKDLKTPGAPRLLELANYFEVTPNYLWGYTDDLGVKSINVIFNNLNEEQKQEMVMISQEWLSSRLKKDVEAL